MKKLLIIVALFSTPLFVFASTIERVSISDAGVEGNGASTPNSMSSDGRYIAFQSDATNLVAGDTNAKTDAFVYDRDTNTTERVSVSDGGVEGNDRSYSVQISSDGRYVAFYSAATNLVVGDTNAVSDVFVYDRDTNTIERVSVDDAGVQGNGGSDYTAISSDGRYVAFYSVATNLVVGDTNGQGDTFVYDRDTNTIERVSVTDGGVEGNGLSLPYAISSDGRYVAFYSTATNLVVGDTNGVSDVFVYDRDTNTIERVSVDDAGVQGNGGIGVPKISSDGRYVAFYSAATNLVAGDTNGVYDSFVHDRDSNTTERISLASDGTQGNGHSFSSAVSSDGRYVAFQSDATNLVVGDINAKTDVFVYDRTLDTVQRVSVTDAGVEGNNNSGANAISSDGRYVAFGSTATNLVAGDTNVVYDVFIIDRGPTITVTVTVINDDDGFLVAEDFTLLLDGDSITNDVTATTTAGTYTVSLADDEGYATTFGGDCASDGSLTMEFGIAYTCVLTVDDPEPEEESPPPSSHNRSQSSADTPSPFTTLTNTPTIPVSPENLTPEEKAELIQEITLKLEELKKQLISLLTQKLEELREELAKLLVAEE